jgi:DNA mismatch endonuclease (patch repair protein)
VINITDIFTKEKRSEIMSRIKGKGTKPEILVRKFLFGHGFRYRLHDEKLPGKPDLVLSKYKSVIFVHGCFWHSHERCKAATLPKTNVEFWKKKIEQNVQRDRENIKALKEQGWNVIVVWDCEIKSKRKRDERFSLLLDEIRGKPNKNGTK